MSCIHSIQEHNFGSDDRYLSSSNVEYKKTIVLLSALYHIIVTGKTYYLHTNEIIRISNFAPLCRVFLAYIQHYLPTIVFQP